MPPTFEFQELNQIHGIDIVENPNNDADGFIVKRNKNYCIKTADCMPIVITGKKGTLFLHAGWRGLHQGILKQKIVLDIEPYHIFIGPHIRACCFEVTSEFTDYFSPEYFIKKEEKLFFDLEKKALDEIKNVDFSLDSPCTCCHKIYNSYRRDKTSKRNYNIYAAK